MSHLPYSQLLKEHTRRAYDDGSARKKRRTRQSMSPDVITIESTSDRSESDVESDEFEDIEFEDVVQQDKDIEDDSEAEMDYSFLNKPQLDDKVSDNITIEIQKQQPEKPTKRKVAYVSKEEREYRIQYHQMYIAAMICHGAVRNHWCNEPELLYKMEKSVSPDIIDELTRIRRNNRMSTVNAVRFTDVVRTLMLGYNSKFRVSKEGLVRKNWNELSIPQTNTIRDMTFTKFKHCIYGFQGSRDVGAQGFLAICRSLGMKARLAFSLQPPDFTMISELPKIDLESSIQHPKSNTRNSKQNFLNKIKPKTQQQSTYKFPQSSYPIFWVEVWNKYNKRWLCVDPIVLKLVEHPPKRRKSSFEPPMSDPTNNLLYVIAYSADGVIKDVTRRYAQQYNSKVVKKRITGKSEEYANWYIKLINSASSSTKLNKVDILELKEFRERDLAEGMPNNAAGFKDHPIYAIESQLRQNEIIYPKDSTTKCGTFRFKTARGKSKDLVEVYKRSAVKYLRSPKAWYLRGRVLKVGEQPLKTKAARKFGKKANTPDFSDDEDQEETRLYADFQTKLYIPPPVENGKIPKNAYGNIDIYVPTMLPDGGYLIRTNENITIKLLEQAARILEIDYAKAIVAFEFGKNGKLSTRIPTAKEGGVVIAVEFKEAMELVVEQLIEDTQRQRMQQIELNALKNWKFILTKLRVTRRLEKSHGKIQDEQQSSDYSVYSEEEGSDFEEGGFVAAEMVVSEDEHPDNVSQQQHFQHFASSNSQEGDDFSDTETGEGGFLVQNQADPISENEPDPSSDNNSSTRTSMMDNSLVSGEDQGNLAIDVPPSEKVLERDILATTREDTSQWAGHPESTSNDSFQPHSINPIGSQVEPSARMPSGNMQVEQNTSNPAANSQFQLTHHTALDNYSSPEKTNRLLPNEVNQPEENKPEDHAIPNQGIDSEENILLTADYLFSQKDGLVVLETIQERNVESAKLSSIDNSQRSDKLSKQLTNGEDVKDDEGYEFEYSDEDD